MKEHLQNGMWILIYGATFIYAITFNTRIAWIPFYFFTFFLTLNALSLSQPLKNLSILETEAILLENDENLKLHLQKTNRKMLYPRIKLVLYLGEQRIESQVEEFQFVKKQAFTFILKQKHRGVFEPKRCEVWVEDLFGIFKRKCRIPLKASVLVLPQKNDNEADAVFAYLLKHHKIALGEFDLRNFDIKNIRNYQSGDRINTIDWKLSSKKQNLIVKEYDKEKETRLQYFFWGTEADTFEALCSLFYSFNLRYINPHQESLTLMSSAFTKQAPKLKDFANIKPIQNDSSLLETLLSRANPNAQKIVFMSSPSPEIRHAFNTRHELRHSLRIVKQRDGSVIAEDETHSDVIRDT